MAGGSAYPRIIDFAAFRAVADEVARLLMVDMAHFAGLVAGGAHPSPFPHAHIVTSTTHKTLRGPRGAMILSNEEALGQEDQFRRLPGYAGRPIDARDCRQGGGICRGAAPRVQARMRATWWRTPRRSAKCWLSAGYDLVSGGTDTHLNLVDLRPKKLTGIAAEKALGRAHITVNKNAVPFDPERPTGDLGHSHRLAGRYHARLRPRRVPHHRTTDGGGAWMAWRAMASPAMARVEAKVREEALGLCERFPIYALKRAFQKGTRARLNAISA